MAGRPSESSEPTMSRTWSWPSCSSAAAEVKIHWSPSAPLGLRFGEHKWVPFEWARLPSSVDSDYPRL